MSYDDCLFRHYYKICNNIDLSNYDDDLIKSIDFTKQKDAKAINKYEGDSDFKKYIENNKILIDEDLYKQYMDLFVYFNFGDKDTAEMGSYYYSRVEGRDYLISDRRLRSFIKAIQETGYVLTLTDIMHFPCVAKYVDLDNIIQDNNKQTLDKIKTLIEYNSLDLDYLYKILLNCNDDEIKLYSRLMTFDGSKTQITNMYKNININPNQSHMLLLLNTLSNYSITTLKNIVNFYDKHGIAVHVRTFGSLNHKRGIELSKPRRDTLKKIVKHVETTKSHKKLCYYNSCPSDEESSDEEMSDSEYAGPVPMKISKKAKKALPPKTYLTDSDSEYEPGPMTRAKVVVSDSDSE